MNVPLLSENRDESLTDQSWLSDWNLCRLRVGRVKTSTPDSKRGQPFSGSFPPTHYCIGGGEADLVRARLFHPPSPARMNMRTAPVASTALN